MSTSKPVSMLEQEYGLFEDSTINASSAPMSGTNSAGLLMRDMNRMYQIVAGLGVVMRIVTGNAVQESEFDPGDPNSAPPLTKAAEGMLTAMAAAMCEEIRDKMERRANEFNRRVKA